ncbi:ATP-binding cassette domain-containing protein [Sutcliffiella horikoshii]|uniref:ATP-binding cassette domain-containing protein n=1 Tax=Sutcliffiella horikoshii TaxID=79883 RepID=A0A5D4T586_9BACI|nr:ATP-binding cassette domain-containing protein [Sutcliffiella horikoshii]TYS69848.1 ATP-binding cassette domain-containing protein [Sutcliffiella horikoshii]
MLKRKVSFNRVSKSFSLYSKQSDKLIELIKMKKSKEKNFYALNQVSFEVFEGETIGVVGVNGSGKSTLSNLLAGVVPQSSGSIDINGDTSLIAISVGLNNQLSGLENIELKCLMHGLNKESIEKLTPRIIEFADIGHFINQPVKNYSSGMKSRLGFAISVFTEPDVLIIDEALSVGDETFYQKCINKINEFKSQGKTIFFISHSISQIRTISDRVMWLHFGKIKEFGDTNTVLGKYSEFIKWFNSLNDEEKRNYKNDNLGNQINERSYSDGYEPQVGPNLKKWKLFLQTCILLLSILISGFLLFIESPSALLLTQFKNLNMFKEEEIDDSNNTSILNSVGSSPSFETINKQAKISLEQATIYYDENLEYKLDNLNFATLIFIEEKFGDIYKIKYGELSGYIESDNVTLIEEIQNNRELSVNDFHVLFPTQFKEAYEYYLSFIGSEYQEVNRLLTGANEEINNQGRTELYYEFENFSYEFNQNNFVDSVKIFNVNMTDEALNNLIKYATFQSKDKNLFYFEIIDFNLILDAKKNTIVLLNIKGV